MGSWSAWAGSVTCSWLPGCTDSVPNVPFRAESRMVLPLVKACAEDPTAPAPCGQLSAQTSVSRCCARGLLGPRSAPRTASQASAKGTKVHRHSVRVCVADPLAFAGEASSAGRTARPAGSTRRCALRAGTALCARRCPVLLRLTFHCLTRLQVTS